MRKIISLVIIICLLITPLVEVQAIASFSSVFGGAIYGKEAFAFMTVMTGLGVTFINQSDAIGVFNDFRENAPIVLSNMVDVVKESWIGAYSTVTSKLISIKNSVYDYFVDKFGTLQVGINQTALYPDFTLSNVGDECIYSIGSYNYRLVYIDSGSSRNLWVCSRNVSSPFDVGTSVNVDIISIVTGLLTYKVSYILNGDSKSYQYTHVINSSLVIDEPSSTTINISSDAGVIDSNFDPDERDPVILPPPYFPGLENLLKERINPNGTKQKYFDGDIDDYLEQAADNNTWSNVNDYLNTGSNTTTLTDTGIGLDVGEISSAPYPDTNIDVPDVLTGIGTIGGLIQGVTNWLSQLVDSISNIFAIPTDLTLNFDNLRLNGFQDRFPFSIPWDIAAAIGVFSASPTTPDLTIDIDTNYFTLNHEIDVSAISLPLRFARYAASVFFVLYLANKTRDLIKW